MPSFIHSYVQAKLVNILFRFDQYNIHSELTLTINNKDYVPDIVLYPQKAFPIKWLKDILKMTKMPLLAIEIISPTQGIKEITDKFEIYFEAGIKSCWLVQPTSNSILVCTSLEDATICANGDVTDETLNISFPLKDLFE